MILAAGVILLQLSAAVPGKPVRPVQANPSPAAASAESSAVVVSPSRWRNIKLADFKFGDAPDASAPAPKASEPDLLNDSAALPPIYIPRIKTKKHDVIRPQQSYPRRPWLALMAAQHGAAAFDAYSTRYAVGHGATEQNPLLRPFAHSPSIYAVSQLTPAALDLVGRRMQRSQNHLVRRLWWLPQTLSAAAYIWAGAHNLQVANSR